MDAHKSLPGQAPLGLLVRLLDLHITRLSAERLSRMDVTPADMSVLSVIEERPGVRPGAVADTLMIKPPNLTKVVNRLEAAGYVRRETSRNDERAVALSLSPRGKRVLAFGREVSREVEDLVLADVPEPARSALVDTLRAALAAARRTERTTTGGRSRMKNLADA